MSTSIEETAETLSDTMTNTWNTYVDAWNAQDRRDREQLLSKATVMDSHYIDPNVDLKGHVALADYMGEFHAQMPDAQFVLTRFISHHQKSIACWDLRDSSDTTLIAGVSYGIYNEQGKLIAEHGFFDTPDTA